MPTKPATVLIRAKIESATPDRTQYKPYATTLTFEDTLFIDIPVPAEHVIEQMKGGQIVLSLEGWTIFLDEYATAVEKMNQRWVNSFNKPAQHKPPY